jgi:hypothetical protein
VLGTYFDTSGASSLDLERDHCILEDAYRLVAPKEAVAELDGRSRATEISSAPSSGVDTYHLRRIAEDRRRSDRSPRSV